MILVCERFKLLYDLQSLDVQDRVWPEAVGQLLES